MENEQAPLIDSALDVRRSRNAAMSAPRQSLTELLSPMDCDLFFRDHWERKPLHVVHNNQHRYSSLFTRRDLDQVLTTTRPRFADPVAFQDVSPAAATYIRGVLAGQPATVPFDPGLADMRDAYDRGKSLVVMSMQHRWPAIATFCRGLEAVFHCPVHANLYLTPASSQGFAAHYDPHEVFALQLDGVKHWRLYDFAEPFPMLETVRMPEGSLGKSHEVSLRPGDLLYIPRGHVHDAYTQDQSSLHLTVGINVYRWADLLDHALASAARHDVRLRKSIPGGAMPSDTARLKAAFRQLLTTLAEDISTDRLFEQALHSLGTQFFRELKMLPGTQFSAPDSESLDADTIFERSSLTICRVIENEHGVAIEFPGNRVTGPRRIGPALRFVAEASRFTIRDLPDDLSIDVRLALARRLVHEGLVTVVGRSSRETLPVQIESLEAGDTIAATEPAVDDEEAPISATGEPQQPVATPR
jgi:ribosomal protein L16 Arg81 hydroxylase